MRGHNIYFFPIGRGGECPWIIPVALYCPVHCCHIVYFSLEVVLYVWMCIIRLTCVHISDFKGFFKL